MSNTRPPLAPAADAALTRQPVRSRWAAWWVLLSALPGCATLPPDAVQRVQTANTHYESRDYQDALALLNRVIRDYPQTDGVGEAYYIRGMCHLQLQQNNTAVSDFEKALKTSKRPELQARVNAQMGHMRYLEEDYAGALPYYRSAVAGYPKQLPLDELYYRYGDCLQKGGQWRKSREVLPKVWHLFPSSKFAPYARRKFSWPHDYFSIQCGAFQRSALARSLATRLRQKNFDAVASVQQQSSRTPHVVYVGSYPEYADALRQLARVRQEASDAFVVP